MRQVPGPERSAPRRHAAWWLVVLALLAACTSGGGQPDPSPSDAPSRVAPSSEPASVSDQPRVAVVISPDPPLRATTADAGVRALGRRLPDVEFRVVTADDRSFLPDLASFLATEGYDLVCVLGPGARDAVVQVAPTAPSARFCASPAHAADLPPNVLAIDQRSDQALYLMARATQAADPGTPIALLTDDDAWLPDRLEGAVRQAVQDADVGGPPVLRAIGLDSDEVAPQVRRLVQAGAVTLLSWAGVLDRAVLEASLELPLPADEPSDPASGDPSEEPSPEAPPAPRTATLVGGPDMRPVEDGAEVEPSVLAFVEVHPEVAVELAVRRLLDGWSTDPAEVGVADGGVVVQPAPTPRGRQIQGLVERLVGRITAGEIEVVGVG